MTLLSLGIFALFAQSLTPATTIRVPVRLVTAPALVFTKQGQLVPGLHRADFRVFDNGSLQEATLDTASMPFSLAIVVQANLDVRQYVPFIAKAGNVVTDLLIGESGEAAVITHNGEVTVVKPFDSGALQPCFKNFSARGRQARMIDAGLRAIALLKDRPLSRTRVVVFIGQPMDSGSESSLVSLQRQAEKENVSIHALTLPEFGKSFVSDTFSLQGASKAEKGGFKVSVDLGKLVAALSRNSKVEQASDPFSVLTAATGGTRIRFRKQKELEDAISTVGIELRSAYLLSYSPSSTETGYHTIKVEVGIPDTKVFSRPGYWFSAD